MYTCVCMHTYTCNFLCLLNRYKNFNAYIYRWFIRVMISSVLLDSAKFFFKSLHYFPFYQQCVWEVLYFLLLSNTWYFQTCYFLLVGCMWHGPLLMFWFVLTSLLVSLSVLSNMWFSTHCPYSLLLDGFSLSYWLEDFLWYSTCCSFIGYMLSSSSLWLVF